MNILFVCKRNRYRSRVAEALFNHYNKNKDIKVKSAGTDVNQPEYPIISIAAYFLNKMNIDYNYKQGAKQASAEIIEWADKIIIVADDANEGLFPANKAIKFPFPDAYSTEKEADGIVNGIKKEILELIKELSCLKV